MPIIHVLEKLIIRSKYRPDLPEIEKTKKGSGKKKLTGCLDTDNEQPTKK